MNSYSFCKFKIPDNSGRVIWEVTNECNYGCKYCIFSSTGRKPDRELSTEQIFETIRQLKDAGFGYIKFTGGEPFLRSDMIDILSYASSLGFDLDISTNASKITPEIAQQLVSLRLNYVHVSIDGYNQDSHESVRGKKSFLPTIKGLELLKQFGNKIRIGTVLHLHNQNYISEMVDYFNTFNVDNITFSIMEPVGRLKDKNKLLVTYSLGDLTKKINQCKTKSQANISHNLESLQTISFTEHLQKSKNTSCPGGEKFLFINSIGVVSPCTWVSEYKKEYHLHSLHEYPLKTILESPIFSKFKKIKNKIAEKIEICPMEALEQFDLIEQSLTIESIEKNNFGLQHPVYSFSTENLTYLLELSCTNKKILTITGSGDQAIVLALHGAKQIINIDINLHSQMYAELKFIALQNLKYEKFKQFFLLNNNSFDYSVYLSFKEKLSSASQNFWDNIYEKFHYEGYALRHSSFFNLKYDINDEKIYNSFYLRNEELYEQAKKSFSHVIIEFLYQDILLHEHLPKNIDLILLSNIADYSHKMFIEKNHVEQFRNSIVSPLLKHLSSNGQIMFAYVFDALNVLGSDKRNHFNNVSIRKKYYSSLGEYNEVYFDSSIKNALNDCICIIKRNINE